MPRFAFVSREVYPFIGGGLSRYVTATASLLAEVGEVTIFTRETFRPLAEDLDPGVVDPRVRFVFVSEDFAHGSYYHPLHRWSAAAYEALKAEYGSEGPDLIEFPDYGGEGFVTAQARRALDPTFANTRVGIRLYTTTELTAVLNGFVPRTFDARALFDIERSTLHLADQIIAPGGDVYGSYQRFFGDDRLAPSARIRHVLLPEQEAPPAGAEASPDAPLRLLYVGRLERRKGVQNLIRALTALDGQDWTLRLFGGDTSTAPLATSMRAQLELMVAGDERIEFAGAAEPRDVATAVAESDVVVMPSLWECWPNVALEAFAASVPVLATPTGGYVELVQPGRSGWLTRDTSQAALRTALDRLVSTKDEVRRLQESGGPREVGAALTGRDEVRAAYLELIDRPSVQPRSQSSGGELVSVVVTYFKLDRYVEETIESVVAQTYRPLEIVVVNDGAVRPEDAILDDLAQRWPIRVFTQPNSGLGAARNFGISQSRGRYVFPLDADDVVAPTFVERCVAVLRERPELAYATSWSRFVDEDGRAIDAQGAGYEPLGISRTLDQLNVAGSAEAVFRKRIFELGHWYSHDLTSYEDWYHFRTLADAGFEGSVIPERLLSYRIRPNSMVRTVAMKQHERLLGEMDAHAIEARTAWVLKSG